MKLIALHKQSEDIQSHYNEHCCLEVDLVINRRRVVGDVDVIRDYCVDEACGFYETEEGVSCTNYVAVFVLEFGHEAGYEYYAACDCKREWEDSC